MSCLLRVLDLHDSLGGLHLRNARNADLEHSLLQTSLDRLHVSVNRELQRPRRSIVYPSNPHELSPSRAIPGGFPEESFLAVVGEFLVALGQQVLLRVLEGDDVVLVVQRHLHASSLMNGGVQYTIR